LTVYVHNFYEWIFVTFQTEYLFAINAAMIAGLAQQLGYWRRVEATRIKPDSVAKPIARPARTFGLNSRR